MLVNTQKMPAVVSVILFVLIAVGWSEMETEDLISNAGFEYEDNLGFPVDWGYSNGDAEENNIIYKIDKETKMAGESALMVTVVGDEGNPKSAMIYQDFLTPVFGQEKIYCKAWIKYKDVSAAHGLQLVVHQGTSLPSQPFFETAKWSSWATFGGSDDWQQVEGEVDIHPDANKWTFRVFLSAGMFSSCTVWVDNIELSTEPVSVSNTLSQKDRATMFSIQGNKVHFNQPANYQMQVFSANGREVYTQSGNNTNVQLARKNMAAGCYVVKIQSDIGSMVKSFIVDAR
jgi:hypothetical protein